MLDMFRRLLLIVVIAAPAGAVLAAPLPATSQPAALAQRVDQLLRRLDSDSSAERETAAGELDQLPLEALPLLEAALRKAGVSPDLRTTLTTPVARMRQATSKQARYHTYLKFYRSQLAGEYERTGQKDPAWDAVARTLLDEAARYEADRLMFRPTTPAAFAAADGVRNARPADPLLRQLAIEFDRSRPLRPAMDLWPAVATSGYSPYRKAAMAALIVNIAGDNQSPVRKDRHGIKKYIIHAGENLAEALRDEKFPSVVAIRMLSGLIADGFAAGVDRKEAFDALDTCLAAVLGEEHLVRLNLRGHYLVGHATDLRNGAGEADWDKSRRQLDLAEAVLRRACELYPDDSHAPTTMMDVVVLQELGMAALDRWFQRAIKADPENYQAYEKKFKVLSETAREGDDDVIGFARQCLASGHFDTRIPLMIVEAHRMFEEPAPWASLQPQPYFADSNVWPDITAAYEGFLAHHPDAADDRAAYAELAWRAGKWSIAAEHYRLLAASPGWDKRNVGLVRLIQLELPLRLAEPQPRADRVAAAEKRDREDAAEMRRLILDPYEAFGRKNPKWDEAARAVLTAAARDWSGDPDRDWGETDVILTMGRRALDAGCDDMLVKYLYQATVDSHVTPRKPAIRIESYPHAVALLGSDYPELIKASALIEAVSCRLWYEKAGDADKAECLKQLDAVIPLLETAVRERQTRDEYIAGCGRELLSCVAAAGGDVKGYYGRLHAAMERAKCDPFALKELQAYFLWQQSVSAIPAGAHGGSGNMAEHELLKRQAGSLCEQLWQERPDRRGAIWVLVQIAGCDGRDRDKVAFWVRQAALADPRHRTAVGMAMTWHSRTTDLEPLARAAAATESWRTQLPFVLVDYQVKVASTGEPRGRPADLPDVQRIAEEDVWRDIATVYEGYLARFPSDSDRRSEYASLACRAGKWLVAIEQMKILGDRVRPKAFVTAERLEACRKKLAALQNVSGMQDGEQPSN